MRKRSALAALIASALTACGGGGSSPPPGPTATPTTSPGGGGSTVLSLQSVPSGLQVAIKTNASTQSETTPNSFTPPLSNFATTVTFAPTNGAAAYTYSTQQNNNGSHTVLYNQNADTTGSIASVSPSSVRSKALGFARSIRPRRPAQSAAARPAYSSKRLIVTYRLDVLRTTGRIPDQIEREAGVARGVEIAPRGSTIGLRAVDVAPGDTAGALAARLRARPEVASVTPERLYYSQTVAPKTPNDQLYDNSDQWSLFVTNTAYGWGYTTGSSAVQVALVDTGIDTTNPDLSSKVTYGERVVNGVTTTGSGYNDTDGHGTNIAGIVAAATNNGYDFASVGWNTSLQIYRVFPDGTSSNGYAATAGEGDITQAIYDAVSHKANVINLSLGTCPAQGIDAPMQTAIQSALSAGVVVVAAAGNERQSSPTSACNGGSSTLDFPAAYDGVIAVGASALNDTANPGNYPTATEYVASYSNAGPGLALVAPGGDPPANEGTTGGPAIDFLHWIEGYDTTTPANPDPTTHCDPSNCIAVFAGTSQSTAYVSGASALLLAAKPGISPATVKSILTSTADDIGDPYEGNGRIDLYRALAAATGDASPPKLPTNKNFVAFAYTPNGSATPNILDVTYTHGVPVSSSGAFRIADIPSGASNYKIGVWYDANGDGMVDAGDFFGSSGTCSATAPCTSAAGIVAHPVPSGFVLN